MYNILILKSFLERNKVKNKFKTLQSLQRNLKRVKEQEISVRLNIHGDPTHRQVPTLLCWKGVFEKGIR